MNRREFIAGVVGSAGALVTGSFLSEAKAVHLPGISTEAQAKAAMHRSMLESSNGPKLVQRVVIEHMGLTCNRGLEQECNMVNYYITDGSNIETTYFPKSEGRMPITTFELPQHAICYFDVGDIIVVKTEYFADVLGRIKLFGLYNKAMMGSHEDLINSVYSKDFLCVRCKERTGNAGLGCSRPCWNLEVEK